MILFEFGKYQITFSVSLPVKILQKAKLHATRNGFQCVSEVTKNTVPVPCLYLGRINLEINFKVKEKLVQLQVCSLCHAVCR